MSILKASTLYCFRLWLSFQSAPTIELKAQPINKVLQYTTMLTQLSGWVRSKVLDGLTRTLVSHQSLRVTAIKSKAHGTIQ